MNPILNEIKEVKKRTRTLVGELSTTADEEASIVTTFGKIRGKVELLPVGEERTALLNMIGEFATRHKAKYDETQKVIMAIEREISFSSEEEGEKKQKRTPSAPVESAAFAIMAKDTFVVPVFGGRDDGPLVATAHLSRAYILNKTDIKCKQCVQSRNETFSGWFTEKHGFNIKKYRLDPMIEEVGGNATLIGQWKAEGYDIKPTQSGGGIKFIPLEQAREWYGREDIGHGKQLQALKKNCTHSPVKK